MAGDDARRGVLLPAVDPYVRGTQRRRPDSEADLTGPGEWRRAILDGDIAGCIEDGGAHAGLAVPLGSWGRVWRSIAVGVASGRAGARSEGRGLSEGDLVGDAGERRRDQDAHHADFEAEQRKRSHGTDHECGEIERVCLGDEEP